MERTLKEQFDKLINDEEFIKCVEEKDLREILTRVLPIWSHKSLEAYEVLVIDSYVSTILEEILTPSTLNQYIRELGAMGFIYAAGVLGVHDLSLSHFEHEGADFAKLFQDERITEKYKFASIHLHDCNIADFKLPVCEVKADTVLVDGNYGNLTQDNCSILFKTTTLTLDTNSFGVSADVTMAPDVLVLTEKAGDEVSMNMVSFTSCFKLISAFSDLKMITFPAVEKIYLDPFDIKTFLTGGLNDITLIIPRDTKVYSTESALRSVRNNIQKI